MYLNFYQAITGDSVRVFFLLFFQFYKTSIRNEYRSEWLSAYRLVQREHPPVFFA